MNFHFITERILTTLWVGGMWITGYLVAPILFSVLDDRQLAGFIAGHIFTAMSYVGLACGGLLLLGSLYRCGVKHKMNYLVIFMLVIVCIGQFVLQPMMAELKAAGIAEGSANAAEFGKLHGIASVLFLANSITGLLLIMGVNQPAGD